MDPSWLVFFLQATPMGFYGLIICQIRQLFGEDDEDQGELDEAEKQGEDGMLSVGLVHDYLSLFTLNSVVSIIQC